ncbi:MAG: family 10 glycosylhydrolase [Myxococcota bacterium]|nr:family 10 glycosylhydrolase [Myxococcota bacterium]
MRPEVSLRVTVASCVFALALGACGGPDVSRDASTLDGATPRDAASSADARADDAGSDASDPTIVREPVASAREIRGAWIPSVWNIVFPSASTLDATQGRAEIVAILDVMEELRMNAAFVQVRPESDALYESSIEPWSRYLSGEQGRDPGWDPLATWITEGHARGIEIHAWINPYRGMASATATTATNHVTRTLSAHAHQYGTQILMDPGAPAVRAHVVSVVRDIVSRYEVDGIHFDDYFYPYPIAGEAFPDDATWAAYVDGGGALELGDWRRQNVHDLVREVSEAIAAERDDVRFGISPFGIYRPGMPSGISGLDAYEAIYCDPLRWIEEGWVDYLAPQLYWRTEAQSFDRLLAWWATHAHEGRTILAGMNHAALIDPVPERRWELATYRDQMSTVQSSLGTGVSGSIAYHVAPLLRNASGVRDAFRDEIWTELALTPPLASADPSVRPAPPTLTREGTSVRVDHADRASLRAFAIYVEAAGGWSLSRIVPAAIGSLELDDATPTAVVAVDRRGIESLARRTPVD